MNAPMRRPGPPIRRTDNRLVLLAGCLLLPLAGCVAASSPAPVTAGAPTAEITADSLLRMAESTRRRGDLSTAALLYRRASEMAPQNMAAQLGLGDTLRQLGLPGDAASAYGRVLADEPGNRQALLGLGGALIEMNQPQQAIPQFEAVLALAPDHRAYNGLGVAHDLIGDHVAARGFYRQGLALAPGNPQILRNNALSLQLSGQ